MLFLLVLSLVGLVVGIYRWKGPVNVVYLGFGVLVHIAYYVTIPISLSLGLLGLAISPVIPESWKLIVLLTGLSIGFAGSLLSTWLFKPAWLKWLEHQHSDILPVLRLEIKNEGVASWNSRIKTKTELESWVLEVRRKHRL